MSGPSTPGTRFGAVTVVVDAVAGACTIHAPVKRRGAVTPQLRVTTYHSLEEISGAYQAQSRIGAANPVAGDIARALKHAGQIIKAKRR